MKARSILKNTLHFLAGLLSGYIGTAMVLVALITTNEIFRTYLIATSLVVIAYPLLFLLFYRKKHLLFGLGLLGGYILWEVTVYSLIQLRQIFL